MAKAYMDDFVCAVEALTVSLKEASNAAAPKIEEALAKWTEATERDARTILDRPRWILQGSITSKVKDYAAGRKIFAMTGFRFRDKNPRDPGNYGQYHEAGWAPDRGKTTVPDHFLREAKKKNRPTLERECKTALSDAMERVREIMKQERIKNRVKK